MSQGPDPASPVAFPFPTSVSLDPLIRRIEETAQEPESPWHPMAAALMPRIQETPGLRGKHSVRSLEPYRELIEKMMTMVFPMAGKDEALGAAIESFRMVPFYQTSAAAELDLFSLDKLVHSAGLPPDLMDAGIAMTAYRFILQAFYGQSSECEQDMVVSIEADNGLRRHMQFSWSAEFMDIIPVGGVPELSKDDLERILSDPLNIDLVASLLPPDRFELSGFGVVTATDVTPREVVSRLKDDLIRKDALGTPERIRLVRTRIRNLLRVPDAEVGFIAFDESPDIERMGWARSVGSSLLFKDGEPPPCPKKSESTYGEALELGHPVVIQELHEGRIATGYEARLFEQGIHSFLLCPLVIDENIIGLMEVGSPTRGALNAYSAMMLIDVAPLFTTAIHRTVEEQADRMEAVIKRSYTSIHPSVEWRFRRAALDIMKQEQEGATLEIPEIVLEEVYPLYGLSDIRGSSVRRSIAIRNDLTRQLRLALSAVQAAASAQPMLVLAEIAHRVEGFIHSVESGLGGDEEQAALGFLTQEVEPLLSQMADAGEEARLAVEAYRGSLDERLGVVYRERKAFEDSVALINNTVSRIIDENEAIAQERFPHLFERFKSDGVDYNLYAGPSIQENDRFSRLVLQELRLWQLVLHCEIEWQSRELIQSLDTPLELTHLILVQDAPLSIRFRADEKRFDVDGAYNIRYEIVKKRIDKATIRGSGERLTQPGTIAVVYSQRQEAAEYRRYLDYLATAGYVEGEPEDLELDELPGAYGLRALRIPVAPPRDTASEGPEAQHLGRNRISSKVVEVTGP
ncbi:MAG: GAF domain-containing protein [Gemmatimonadetes bacterium]|nr:GAF domain-containing protein [Gemmatimonadota bacterium]